MKNRYNHTIYYHIPISCYDYGWIPWSLIDSIESILVGGFSPPTPLKNDGVSNSWDDDIPFPYIYILWKVIKFHGSKPPTSIEFRKHSRPVDHQASPSIRSGTAATTKSANKRSPSGVSGPHWRIGPWLVNGDSPMVNVGFDPCPFQWECCEHSIFFIVSWELMGFNRIS